MAATLDADRREAPAPLFDDTSVIRRVNGESAVLLGGGRALLMQVAHPLVAAGVAEHSRFEADRFGRLLRTLRATYTLVFGSPEQARAAAERVNAAHSTVAGAGYYARDPALLLWVHATLVDSGIEAYSRFVRPLTCDERQRYYDECSQCAMLLGVPPSALPPSIEAFDAYVARMVATLEVSDDGRRIARAVFATRPLRSAPVLVLARELTAGLLPRRLRAQFGLNWDPARAALLDGAARASRLAVPHLPRALRRPPRMLVPPGVRIP